MPLTLNEALEALDDSLNCLGQLYRLQTLSHTAVSVESQALLPLATAHAVYPFSETEVAVEGITEWIKVAWAKIKAAVQALWKMIKDLFKEDHDEKEEKKTKARQARVKAILAEAGHNVKFDEVSYLDDSLAHHFSYSKYNTIEDDALIQQLLALSPVIPYLDSIATSMLQAQVVLKSALDGPVPSEQELLNLNMMLTKLIQDEAGKINYVQPIDRGVYQQLGIEANTVNKDGSGYLDVLLSNHKLYIFDIYPVDGPQHLRFRVALDPRLKTHPVKVAYLSAELLQTFNVTLDTILHQTLQVQESLIQKVNIAEKTSLTLQASLERMLTSEPEQAAATLKAANTLLKTTLQPLLDLVQCYKKIRRDLKVYQAIEEAHINHYRT